MNLTEHICHMAARYDAVAFDVFDTLIKRDTAAPTNLFRLRGEAFYTARTRAEREARAAKSGEVTLAEIYARPCLARYDAAAECAAELAACAANKPVLDAVQTLKEQGKKLYYISDMYLPQTQIDALLRRHPAAKTVCITSPTYYGVVAPVGEIAAVCRRSGKPFLVVTQLLHSMIDHPTPTRAEVLDIYNAVLDGADCLMLTGETAQGRYPQEAADWLIRVAQEAEKAR